MPKLKFILKISSLKCWLCFRVFLFLDTKLIYAYNFVAPLRDAPDYCVHAQVMIKCLRRT